MNRRTIRSRWIAIVALLGVSVSFSGCDESPSDVDLLVVGGVSNRPANALVTVRVEQPGRLTLVTNAELLAAETTGDAIRVRTKTSGTMRVRYVMTTTPGDTLADVEIPFALQNGNQYGISAFRSPANYVMHCFGCTSITRIPLRGSAQPTTDSLTFYIANARPCRGCVY
jgi:hypothetical protein